LYYDDLIFDLSKFIDSSPCALAKIIYEKQILPDGPKIFGRIDFKEFLKLGLYEVQPFIKNHFDSDAFQDFYNKYIILVREYIAKTLRNKAR
jgi:hypothetical protein